MNDDYGSIPSTTLLSPDQLTRLYELSQKAGAAILEVYQDERLWDAENKADNTPVTAADIKSSEILVAELASIYDCPVVSEEALPGYSERQAWPEYWLVDPMDGTKEFIHKTGEFVIAIALMKKHQPVYGFIYQPTTGQAWWGGPGFGAFTGNPDNVVELPDSDLGSELIALGSRRSKWQGDWRSKLEAAGHSVSTQSVGSALKFMRLADGCADLYPRLGPTCEWDTAAAQAILHEVGGAICQWDGRSLVYGKEDVLNPNFIAVRDRRLLDLLLK